ncbi:unnamed protein product [Periconia digitata]|uniref:AAA+ ATPase domain-containing protein n=1 Tax=Periconia digitata TaxID=1303443 RepID=A0A9W4UVY3_9PLEO|nr:unnamed protein product [Periconia digitata]
MATTEEAPSVSDLLEKIAAFEKRISELELKNSGTPLTETALAQKDAAVNSETKPEENVIKENNEPQNKEKNESDDPRVKIIISRIDPETGEPIEEDSKVKTSKDTKEQFAFILKKNVYDNKGGGDREENSSEIEIISPGLWNLLKEKLGHYPYHIFQGSAPSTLQSPYEYFVYDFDELQETANKDSVDAKDREARQDLAKLLKIISNETSGDANLDKYFKARMNSAKASRDNQPKPETVQFMNLWTIFPPGTLVYGKPFQNQDQVFLVRDIQLTWPIKHGREQTYSPWKLSAWSYDWKDGRFIRTEYTLQFEYFEGHSPVSSLPFAPFDSVPNRDSIKENLVLRGKRFRKICEAEEEGRLFEYRGQAIREQKGFSGMKNDEESSHDGDYGSRSYHSIFQRLLFGPRLGLSNVIPTAKSDDINSRVMVDYSSYFQYGPADGRNGALEPTNSEAPCGCLNCQTNSGLIERSRAWLDDLKYSNAKEWKEEQYLLCPPRVLGYILKEKHWAQFQVTQLIDLPSYRKEETEEQFSRLRLADDLDDKKRAGLKKKDTSTKRLIYDLVQSHASSAHKDDDDEQKDKLEIDDIIPDKGKGLIILLYGPPGVGKTSTAEVVARATGKPLFSVSVADVGTQAKHVESNLSRIFTLATRWKAILLLDEADVFLETRSTGKRVQSADKNALVSVFLRVLEYYHGIMFLTTNNIATFDIAIPSRVHVAIKYDSLNVDQMKAIFKGFLDKLNENNAVDDYDEIMDTWFDENIRKAQFDGRQIRNTVTVALGLARASRDNNLSNNSLSNGKLTQDHLKMAFENVKNFQSEFRSQMQRYIDDQGGMVK